MIAYLFFVWIKWYVMKRMKNMKRVIAIGGELLFRLKLLVLGVRFYEAPANMDTEPDKEVVFEVSPVTKIRLQFRKIECTDIILRRGKLTTHAYNSYVVAAFFGASLHEYAEAFNGKPYFFNGSCNGFGVHESRVLELLADIYLDFLKKKI